MIQSPFLPAFLPTSLPLQMRFIVANNVGPRTFYAFCQQGMTTFLPSTTFNVSQANAASYKANFARLAKAVFCVGSGPAYDGGAYIQ